MSNEESGSEDENDWLDLDLGQPAAIERKTLFEEQPLNLDTEKSIQIDENVIREKKPAKKASLKITAADRKIRLQIHQMHLLCLTYHLCIRNSWCNDKVLKNLARFVPPGIKASLHCSPQKSQMIRNKSFHQALVALTEIWKRHFKIIRNGLRRPWYGALQNDTLGCEPVSKEDFLKAAKSLEGDRDMGCQLFVSLLRSLDIPARLVFSLQTLSFRFVGASAEGQSPQTSANFSQDSLEYLFSPNPSDVSPAAPKRRRTLKPTFSSSSPIRASPAVYEQQLIDSPKPVFWAEAFNTSMQKWVCIDPFGDASSVGKPSRFEPSSSDPLNQMAYVFAVDSHRYLKDVTRRYTSHYYRIMRNRLEIFPFGSDWLNSFLSKLKKPQEMYRDSDAIEDAELLRLEQAEGIPKNIQDLKDHPVFAIERHLRKNEVIDPKKSCGRISTKKGVEFVYPRKYVRLVFSADRWYRKGRIVKPGAQPLKHATDKTKGNIPLYAEDQTDIYTPKPVVADIVPKNAYGNIDLYTSNMLPYGAYHCTHEFAEKAAKLLEIDYARAVTSFDFHKRMSRPHYTGIVTSKKFKEALLQVAEGIEWIQEEENYKQNVKMGVQLWKRILSGLQIRQRIMEEYG
ncbi:DNA repair protein Rhp41 [Schizosaccharomyces cryophilus OY26]|uniref:DNA repair protein Rhp41 n=1 Tax=Schizosaccharomyces cryophilus (strain OY26 / ATCC MYA-4695 / CBS 11777 / NBRC 106824 / NRRL Y48691) TaxID=653667 RepID=S9VR54_SCHCR|nr:DNA repair protein Rhp41 [Schizosaccharomyces cryophilus OY26]EPY50418.1 DNA repair protein Rhp41 [Schizosaccharomyces cryophilus OY26]